MNVCIHSAITNEIRVRVDECSRNELRILELIFIFRMIVQSTTFKPAFTNWFKLERNCRLHDVNELIFSFNNYLIRIHFFFFTI